MLSIFILDFVVSTFDPLYIQAILFAIGIMPSALNVKVKKFNHTWVNGGSIYTSCFQQKSKLHYDNQGLVFYYSGYMAAL